MKMENEQGPTNGERESDWRKITIVTQKGHKNTLAHIAADLGWTEELKVLLEAFPHFIMLENGGGQLLIHRAVMRGRYECLEYLLRINSVVTRLRFEHGATLLHTAARYNQLVSVGVLMRYGAIDVINYMDADGMTALDYACRHVRDRRDYAMYELLVGYGAKCGGGRKMPYAVKEPVRCDSQLNVFKLLVERQLVFIGRKECDNDANTKIAELMEGLMSHARPRLHAKSGQNNG